MSSSMATPEIQSSPEMAYYKPFIQMGWKGFVSAIILTFRVHWLAFLLLGVAFWTLSSLIELAYRIVYEYLYADIRNYPSMISGLTINLAYFAVYWLFNSAIVLAIYNIAIGACENNKESIPEILARTFSWFVFWKYLLTSILLNILFAFGILLFVIPGIIWAIEYTLAPAISIIEGVGVRQAFSRSSFLTEKKKAKIFGYWNIIAIVGVWLPFTILMGIIAVASGLPFLVESVTRVMPLPLWARILILIRTIVIQWSLGIFTVILYKSLMLEKQSQT